MKSVLWWNSSKHRLSQDIIFLAFKTKWKINIFSFIIFPVISEPILTISVSDESFLRLLDSISQESTLNKHLLFHLKSYYPTSQNQKTLA